MRGYSGVPNPRRTDGRMTDLMALLQRERDELRYTIELREGYLTSMCERLAELDRRIAEEEARRTNGGAWSF